MVTFTYTVGDENGIHARPAGALAVCAKKYDSDIKIFKLADGGDAEREADATRLLSVMGLGARHGDKLRFIVDGADESDAAQALEKCCYEYIG